MVKWKEEKEFLEQAIKSGVSYVKLGKKYNCSDTAVKKAAQRLGIEIPQRRKINPSETFNRRVLEKGFCLNCGKEIILYPTTTGKFCSCQCFSDYQYKRKVEDWHEGKISGNQKFTYSAFIRRYLFEKYDSKCQLCGWGEVNSYTGKVPLQVHHIDGNSENNKEENLQLLCPNCHSLTENFGSRNKNASHGRSEYFGRKKKRSKWPLSSTERAINS